MHFQLSENMSQLKKAEEELNMHLEKIEQNKTKDTIKFLEANDESLNQQELKVSENCKAIFQFNLAFQYLIRKVANLNRSFDLIVRRIKTKKKIKRTFYDSTQGFISKLQDLLERSPEEVLLRWHSCIFDRGSRASSNSSLG